MHNNLWEDKMRQINTDHTSVWKLAKALRKKQTITPPLEGPHGPVLDDLDKSELLADSIERQCQLNPLPDVDTETEVRTALNNPPDPLAPPLRPATFLELETIIARLKSKKAPGSDGVSNSTIKHLPKKSRVKLLNIVNACLRTNHFPAPWKTARIITIPKAGKDLRQPANHRPISLLSGMSKILERILLHRLQEEVDDLEILPDEQFGFRHGHSTEQQTLRLVEHISEALHRKHSTAALYLDISKAFDKVWHEGLYYKLLQAQVNPNMVTTIRSFLSHRKFQVQVGSSISTVRDVQAGVPQGSVLAPLLYTLYTADLPPLPGTNKALFADDTAIFKTSPNVKFAVRKLQAASDTLSTWFRKWKLTVNSDKSQLVLYTRRRAPARPNFVINNERVEWKNDAKYLGLTIDRHLTWEKHTGDLKQKGRALIRSLAPLLRSNTLTLRTKRILYTTLVRPAVTYSIPSWGYAAKTHVNKIQVIQNKILRAISNAPWFVSNAQLHRDLEVPRISDFARDRATHLYAKLEHHANPLLKRLAEDVLDPLHPRKRPRQLSDV